MKKIAFFSAIFFLIFAYENGFGIAQETTDVCFIYINIKERNYIDQVDGPNLVPVIKPGKVKDYQDVENKSKIMSQKSLNAIACFLQNGFMVKIIKRGVVYHTVQIIDKNGSILCWGEVYADHIKCAKAD